MVVRCLMVLIANAREARCLMVVMTMLTILFLFSQCCYSVCSFGGEPSTLGERILQEHRGYLLLALFGASLTNKRTTFKPRNARTNHLEKMEDQSRDLNSEFPGVLWITHHHHGCALLYDAARSPHHHGKCPSPC